jgi:hypothetical protein
MYPMSAGRSPHGIRPTNLSCGRTVGLQLNGKCKMLCVHDRQRIACMLMHFDELFRHEAARNKTTTEKRECESNQNIINNTTKQNDEKHVHKIYSLLS